MPVDHAATRSERIRLFIVDDHPIVRRPPQGPAGASQHGTRIDRVYALPGLLCSGFNHPMHAAKAQALGPDACFFKPLLHRDLELAVQRGLEERRAQSC